MTMRLKPDIILMDVRMPNLDGVQATMRIHELYPSIKIIMLTTFKDDEYVKLALKAGAIGYLLKNIPPDELIKSVRMARNSVMQLSPEVASFLAQSDLDPGDALSDASNPIERLTLREREILQLILEAMGNKDIAKNLNLTEQTVKNYVHKLYEKLGITSRLELIKLMNLKP
jgi:DNA-binding NarL/FixJ family response regulator